MNSSQMKRIHNESMTEPNEIYVLLRVYKLGQEGMGMRMIIDPQAEREKGQLTFEADTYTVTQTGNLPT